MKVFTPRFGIPAKDNSSVNPASKLDEERAYCEKLLKLADIALQVPIRQNYKKAS